MVSMAELSRRLVLVLAFASLLSCRAAPEARPPATPTPPAQPVASDEGWRPLFDGKSLEGWETYLGKPWPWKENEPVGLNLDPVGNYSVVMEDGAPAIRISGEIWGALTSKEEFENYHLRLEFKWGQKRWPPREDTVRDSGLLYHCVGPHGAGSGFWMRSFEIQIQEGDCGDFHSVAGVLVDTEAVPFDPAKPDGIMVHKPGAPMVAGIKRRIIKDGDYERPTGQWNQIEIVCLGDTALHIVNGRVNLRLKNLRHVVDGNEVPLTRGKIQLQSEAAEIFYRNIEVRPITRVPDPYATQLSAAGRGAI
jgi:hypothetical protein